MVTDRQVRLLMEFLGKGRTLRSASGGAGMDEKTARKYVRSGRFPSEMAAPHTWRTREDPFAAVWGEAREFLETNPGLEAKSLFEYLQRRYPGRFSDGQLRTFQRRVREWRAREGPGREVMFAQRHDPGRLCQSDFTHMGTLGVTIGGAPFDHLVYHFVLTYSNWETGSVCFSESFESLGAGLGRALFELGGVPASHRTDCLTAAVQKLDGTEAFTRRYEALLGHYGLKGCRTQPSHPNENGDVEQSHHRFKRALEQALLLRGSRDFESLEAYEAFLREIFAQRNAGRAARFAEERAHLRRLPLGGFEACRRLEATVGPGSTITVQGNVYSVSSRLIGRKVRVDVTSDYVEVWLDRVRFERLARLRGKGKHRINYRHVIDWLVRKPGAFEGYVYREALFPSSRFRMAYDALREASPARGHKEYLRILELAAKRSETGVEAALDRLLRGEGGELSFDAVRDLLDAQGELEAPREVRVAPVRLSDYDRLLATGGGGS